MFSSAPVAATGATVIDLKIEIDIYESKFSYSYSKLEHILPYGQKIFVRLDKKKTPPGATIYICGFSSTDTGALPLRLPLKADGSSHALGEGFDAALNVQEVGFEFNPSPGQLVSFGIHVHCEFRDVNGKPQTCTELCDPQVGNGPP